MEEYKPNLWDFYTGSNNSTPASTTIQSSNTLGSVTNTANSWLDSLGSTFLKYTELKTAYDATKNTQNDATVRAYENITQKVDNSNFLSDNKNMLIYGGIGLVAVFLMFGGRK